VTFLPDDHYNHQTDASLQMLRQMKKTRIMIAGGAKLNALTGTSPWKEQ
jgi:hypothetical protein